MGHLRAVISGVNSVNDLFNFSFSVNGGPSDDAAAVAAAIKSAFNAQWTTFQPAGGTFAGLFYSTTIFQKITVYERPVDPTADATDVAEELLSGKQGAQTDGSLPPETALCISLNTGHPGRKWHGRMYLPALHKGALNTDGTCQDAKYKTAAEWTAAFFGDINDGIKHVVLWSRVDMAMRNITSVRAGNQFDVITRRQNVSPETYWPVTVSQV
jgi:hypothetical protein